MDIWSKGMNNWSQEIKNGGGGGGTKRVHPPREKWRTGELGWAGPLLLTFCLATRFQFPPFFPFSNFLLASPYLVKAGQNRIPPTSGPAPYSTFPFSGFEMILLLPHPPGTIPGPTALHGSQPRVERAGNLGSCSLSLS